MAYSWLQFLSSSLEGKYYAKGDHDAAMNAVNQNRNTMNQQYQNTGSQMQNQYQQAQGTFNQGQQQQQQAITGFNPSYSFLGSPSVPSYGSTAPTTGARPLSQPQTGTPQPLAQGQSSFDYSGYDPRLAQVFQNAGITPTGRGTGNTDIAYWQDQLSKPGADANYFLGRLQGDLSGSGMDSRNNGFVQGPQADLSYIMPFVNNMMQQVGQYGQGVNNAVGQYGTGVQGQLGQYGQQTGQALGQFGQNETPFYQNMMATGGFSPQDIQSMKEANIAPTRSLYDTAQNNLAQQLELTGGYSPNAGATQVQLARDMSNQIGNQNIQTNAALAQMIQQGKLSGAQGLSGIDTSRLSGQLGAAGTQLGAGMTGLGTGLGAQMQGLGTGLQAGMGAQEAGLGAMGQGTLANLGAAMQMAGIQSQQEIMANQQKLQQLGLGNQLQGMNLQNLGMGQQGMLTNQGQQGQYGLGSLQAQNQASQIPGDFAQAMGNIGSVVGLGGQVAGAFMGVPNFSGNSFGSNNGQSMSGYNYGNPYGSYGTGMPMYGTSPNQFGGWAGSTNGINPYFNFNSGLPNIYGPTNLNLGGQ